MIVLTQNGAGDINASFVKTETLEQCHQKMLVVEGVFKASDIAVIESRCLKSDLRFSEFGHASSSSQIRNFYLLTFDDESVHVTKESDWKSCMEQQRKGVKHGRVYCGSSVQSLKLPGI